MKKNKIYLLLAFVIPFLVYSMAFYVNGILTNKVMIYDFLQQYYPLFNHLKDLLNGDANLFYNYSYNLGGTLFGAFFYYLSSPLNILLLFVSKSNIINFMNFLIILKLSLSGLTMYLFLKKKFQKDDIVTLLFSLCYSLMGYNISYTINIFWLDIVFLAPLVLIGLENILDNKKPTIYMVTLFLSILSNYYLAYSLCIFIVIYYVYELLIRYNLKTDKKIIIRKIFELIIPSLLIGLTCSFFLIPCYLESSNYGRGMDFLNYFKINFDYLSIFPKMYLGTSGGEIVTTSLYSPNIYCGIITLPLVYLYLVNKDIAKKERKYTLLVLILLFLPCISHGLNFAVHLFTSPLGFNYRFSFLLCLFMIVIAYKSLLNLNISLKKIIIYLVIYLLITIDIIICMEFNIFDHFTFINYYCLLISVILLLVYFILFFKNKKNIVTYISIIELVINVFICMSTIPLFDRNIFDNYYFNKDNTSISDYRIYNNAAITYGDNLLYKNRDIALNFSTDNYRKKELYSNTHIDKFNNHFSIMDDLLSVKYVFMEKKNNINNYKKIDSGYSRNKKYNLYMNPDALSIGYMIKNKCNNIKSKNKKFLYDQSILNCLIDEENDYYKEIEPNKGKNINTYDILDNDVYVIYIEKDVEDSDYYNKYFNIDKKDMILSRRYTKYQLFIVRNNKDNFKLKIKNINKMDKVQVFYYDKKSVDEKIDILAKEQLDYKIYKNSVKGTIKTDGGILMLTIPYEKGFSIYVDGKKTPYYEVMDTFIGIDLTKGKHEIVIKYKQPGLLIGIVVSVISFIMSIIYLIWFNKKSNN